MVLRDWLALVSMQMVGWGTLHNACTLSCLEESSMHNADNECSGCRPGRYPLREEGMRLRVELMLVSLALL